MTRHEMPQRRSYGSLTAQVKGLEVGDCLDLSLRDAKAIHSVFRAIGYRCITERVDADTVRVWRRS